MDAADGLTGRQKELLVRYAVLLRSSPHNLLSPRALRELEQRHFPEGIAFATLLPEVDRLLDVGSGGGLPGIVVAIVRPDVTVHLLEATKKKVDFMTEAVARLELPVTVHHGRAEELASGDLRGAFDVVTARAVAPLDRLVPWCAPFLRVGGKLYAIKGERWVEELAAASEALVSAGMVVHETPDVVEGQDRAADTPLVVVLERANSTGSGQGLRPSRAPRRWIGHKPKT